MTRQTVTRDQAETALAAIRSTFAAYCEPMTIDGETYPALSDGPKLIDGTDYDGRPDPIIVWEDGAPYEWTYLASMGGVDQETASLAAEFGGTVKPTPAASEHPAWPAGVWAEPVNTVTLALYLA